MNNITTPGSANSTLTETNWTTSSLVTNETTTFDNLTTSTPLSTAHKSADCGLEPGQCDIIRIIKEVTLSISITALVISIVCFIILRKYRLFHQRVIFHLLISNLCSAATIISSDATPELANTAACIAQGFMVQFFGFAEVLWFWNLTFVLFMHLVKERDTVSFEWVYIGVGWGVPLLTACLPLITMDYGPAEAPYCWLESDAWRFGVYWGPVFVELVVIVAMFIYMIWHTKRAMGRYTEPCDKFTRKHKVLVKSYLKPLTWYAATFLLLNLVQIANRIQNAVHPSPIFSFTIFHTAIISCYGMILSMLFVITNGRKEFTPEKFKNGILCHVKSIRSWRRNRNRPTVVMFSATSMVAQAAEIHRNAIDVGERHLGESSCHTNPNLPVHVDESVLDSGIEEVDTRDDVGNIQ